MNSKIVFEKVGQYVRKNLIYVSFTALLITLLRGVSTFFEDGGVDSLETNSDLLIGLALTILASIISVYFAIEIYESIKENRKASFISALKQIPKRKFKMIFLQIIIAIKTFLWALLLVIPGIIKAFEYQRATYALVKNPELSIPEAFAIANKDMYGNKGKLFWIGLKIALPAILGVIIASIAISSEVSITSNYELGINEIIKNLPTDILPIMLLIFAFLGFIYSALMNFPLQPVFNHELDKVTDVEIEEIIE